MKCEIFISKIDDFVDATLQPIECQEMQAHLTICQSCRDELRCLHFILNGAAGICEKPDRDLWPQIAAEIVAMDRTKGATHLREISRLKNGSHPAPRMGRILWRFAAVVIFGTMLIWAANHFRGRSLVTKTNGRVNEIEAVRKPQIQSASSDQNQTQDFNLKQAAQSGIQNETSARDYAEACQCGPSTSISNLIDRAWIIDESLPFYKARAVLRDRLYELAIDNAQSFFLHKASIEARSFPMQADHVSIQRYRAKLGKYPQNPGWAYLYAYSLFGKDTSEMIRLMQATIDQHPEFPWPNLALAEIYGIFNYRNDAKAQAYMQAFMRLCPDSPEPIRLLVSLEDSKFLASAVRRMRTNLAMRSDIRSLLLYRDLWYLEGVRGAGREDASVVQQKIKEDLNRLQMLEPGRRTQLAEVIRSGYLSIGDRDTFQNLLNKDTGLSGRWGSVALKMREWDKDNPAPSGDAAPDRQNTYWKGRLRILDSLIERMPENPSLWAAKLEALTKLGTCSEVDFAEIASKILLLERDWAELSWLDTNFRWKSNILKLAFLCGERGIYLDLVPTLIEEGHAIAERYSTEHINDLQRDPEWALLSRKLSIWFEADDAWYSLVSANIKSGKIAEASKALEIMESKLRESKSNLTTGFRISGTRDDSIEEAQRKSMANQIADREKRIAVARARVCMAVKG
jgi:hypothetical protein